MPVDIRPSLTKTIPHGRSLDAWFTGLICVGSALSVFAIAFSHEISGAIEVWIASTAYNHCFLVLPLFGFMLWSRRSTIASLQPRPAPWVLLAIPPLVALWAIAALMDVLEGEQLFVVCLFEAFLIATLGWTVFRALLAPFLFLFFLVPFGAFLVPSLQIFTTDFTVHGLELIGIPVFADHFLIQIPEGSFEVAEACAGLRFLIASIVFGYFFATIIYRSVLRRAIFVALSIIVPVIANGLRAFGLLFLAHLEGSASAVAADHVIYGWLFFSLITFLLIIVGLSFGETKFAAATVNRPDTRGAASSIGTAVTAGVGLLLILVGPIYLTAIDRADAAPEASPLALPIKPWIYESTIKTDWSLHIPGAHRETLDTYRDGDTVVSEFAALFPLPTRGSPFTKAANELAAPKPWRFTSRDQVTVAVHGQEIKVNADVMSWSSRRRVVWWFYVADDQLTSSTLVAKLLQVQTALGRGHHLGVFVAVTTQYEDAAQAEAALTRFLEAIGVGKSIHPARAPFGLEFR